MGLWVDQNRPEQVLPIAAETAKQLRNLISQNGQVKDRELDEAIANVQRIIAERMQETQTREK